MRACVCVLPCTTCLCVLALTVVTLHAATRSSPSANKFLSYRTDGSLRLALKFVHFGLEYLDMLR